MNRGKFFSRSHWLAFWVVYAIVQLVYCYTVAPSVTLEDSGELGTAAASFGVPHPPGYPFWTMVTWLFIHLVPFGNIAWRANLCSGFFGALSCGVIALITSFLAERFSNAPAIRKNLPRDAYPGFLFFAAGVLGGLSLGFLESLWSQSVIIEVYSLNAFVFSLILLFMLRWLYDPGRLLWGFLTLLFYGLGLTNHQTLLLFAPALLLFVAFVNWRILRDLLPYVLMAGSTMCWCTRTKFAIVVTGFLYVVYAAMLIYSCRESLDADRIVFLAISLVLPVAAGFLAAECVNDVSSFSTLTNRIDFHWALLLLIFCVWFQLLLSFFGSWRILAPYALVLASAISIAKQDEYAIGITIALGAFIAVEFIRPRRQMFGPLQLVLLLALLLLPLLGGAAAATCISRQWEFPLLAVTRLIPVGAAGLQDIGMAAIIVLIVIVAAMLPLALMARGRGNVLWNGRSALLLILAGILGVSAYFYLPLSAKTNPPMNWSYAGTVSGFVHSVTRGQYDAIREGRDTKDFFKQIEFYYTNLVSNYTLPIALLAVLALIGIFDSGETEKKYAAVLLVGWLFLSLVLTYITNTSFEEQTLFVYRVFYATAHMIFSIWVGLGIVVLFTLVNQIRTIQSWIIALGFVTTLMLLAAGFKSEFLVYPTLLFFIFIFIIFLWCSFRFQMLRSTRYIAVFFLPTLLAINNGWRNDWRPWGSDQRGHDFGWMFGYDMLKNMDRDAVLFGGTDPGRFVPTYMIFVESFAKPEHRYSKGRDFDRRDLYIITQNALADSTYMSYIRDHYAETRPTNYNRIEKWLGRDKTYPRKPLKIPDLDRCNELFNQVCEELRNQPNSGVTIIKEENGTQRLGAEGVNAIFAINGAIARDIFENNKKDHAFYVEESFPLNWMYPYLEPFGLIMKLNKEPIPKIPDEAVRRDMAFWNQYMTRLLSDPRFLDDIVARRAFAKLRSTTGGLYAFRGMKKEAEIALRQALALFEGSSEAATRLIDIYIKQERYDEARVVALFLLDSDPDNKALIDVLRNIELIMQMAVNRLPLTIRFQANPSDSFIFLQLTTVLANLQKFDELDSVVSRYLKTMSPESGALQKVVQMYDNAKVIGRMSALLKNETRTQPNNYQIWYNLAVAQSWSEQIEEGVKSLKRAIQLNPNLKSYARTDPRLENLRASLDFQKITQ